MIWVHDYQLSLVPKYIREKYPEAKIALFWHIPWPPWEIYGNLPWRREIVAGMMGADFIGFHTPSLVNNFFSTVDKLKGGTENRTKNLVELKSNEFRERAVVKDIPLGIDVSFFEPSEEQQKKGEQLRDNFGTDHIVLSVDRLDYTKGINRRLEAIAEFFESYSEYKERVCFVQRIAPSRSEVERYKIMRDDIEKKVSRINGQLRTETWKPVHYFYQSLPQQKLIPYYVAADVGLLTPLIDGMNLTAKEYVAANQQGALILSEFAGAAESLVNAIKVNPNHTSQVAVAVKRAIEKEPEEKKKECKLMKEKLHRYDINWWREAFKDEWKTVYTPESPL